MIDRSLGVGVGYREELREFIGAHIDEIDVLEVITETLFDADSAARDEILALDRPIVLHGIHLSPGSAEPPPADYVRRVRAIVSDLKPLFVSDHLSISRFGSRNIGTLSPLSFDERSVDHIVRSLREFKTEIGCDFALENIAYYYHMPHAQMSEAEFLTRIVTAVDCDILLDLANLYANARNLGYDTAGFLDAIPLERVTQVHLAGGALRSGIFVDTHGHAVAEEVWELYRRISRDAPRLTATIIERDQNFDEDEILAELRRARAIRAEHLAA